MGSPALVFAVLLAASAAAALTIGKDALTLTRRADVASGQTRAVSGAMANEQALADALADTNRPDAEVRRQVDAVPARQRFDQPEKWLALARDARLPAWRRLAAYGLLLDRCLTYPVDRKTFVREALSPLGLETAQWFDMTVGQQVPVKRGDDLVIRMVHLPIETPVGQAAVYMSLRQATDTIEQAAVSPDLDRAAGHLHIP